MGSAIQSRRQFLAGSVVLAGLGLLAGCRLLAAGKPGAPQAVTGEEIQSYYPRVGLGESVRTWFILRDSGIATWLANGANSYGYRTTDRCGWCEHAGSTHGGHMPI